MAQHYAECPICGHLVTWYDGGEDAGECPCGVNVRLYVANYQATQQAPCRPVMKTPPPLSPRPLTPLQERRLFDAIWDARHPPSGLRADRLCALCKWPVHPQLRGRQKAHDDPAYGLLCGRCDAAPVDTPEAMHAIDRLRARRILREEGL